MFNDLWSVYVETVLHYLGVAVHLAAAMALISAAVCLAFDEPVAVPALLVCALSLALGQALFHGVGAAEAKQVCRAMDTAVLAWLAISVTSLRDAT